MAAAAAARAVAAVRSSAVTAATGGLRRMYSIFADLDLKREPDLPPKVDPSTKLFVAGLNKQTTSEGLREAFSKFGQVVDVHVATDRASGFSRGFGFVRYATLEEAEAGKKGMDGKFLDGWVIFAEYAKPKLPPRPAAEHWQSPPVEGVTHNNAMGGNPQSPPPHQSNPSYHSPPSFQSHTSYHTPLSDDHEGYKNAGPMNPRTPPSVPDIHLTNLTSGNPQSPPPYQSQPSYHSSASYQSHPSYHTPVSNEHEGYKNAAPVNPQIPPSVPDIRLTNLRSGNPVSPLPYQSQPSYQSPPSYQYQPSSHTPSSNGHYSYNSTPAHPQVPPSYQGIGVNNAVAGSPPSPSTYKSQPFFQCPPSNEHNGYNDAAPANQQSVPSYQPDYNPVSTPSHQHTTTYGNQVYVNPPQSPTSYQHSSYNGYSNMAPTSPQSPPYYQHNTGNNMVREDPPSPPLRPDGNYDYQMPENPEPEPAYQYGS